MAGRIIDIDGAVAYLGLTESQIRGLVARHQVPFMKIGRSLRFDIRTLDRWIEKQHQVSA